jgi:hypothetical protein
MNREDAKRLLPIIQAYAEGKEIQVKTPIGWRPSSEMVHFELRPDHYRIKPESVKIRYRRYLYKGSNSPKMGICTDGDYSYSVPMEKPRFIKWIDPDWIEYEYTPE